MALGAQVAGEVELTNSRNLAVRKHKDYAGVVLWLEPVDRPVPALPPKRVEMLQKDKLFQPHVVAISLGSTVTLRYEGDDEDDTQQFFVGSIEERQGDLPVVSPSSPLGQVLIGRGAGDAVEYQAPGGMLKVHIAAVAH